MKTFTAKVVKGEGRGKKLGLPTANLDLKELGIREGVYAAEIMHKGKKYFGLLHYGPKKTFNQGLSLEVHICGFKRNIYGSILKVKIKGKIREIKKFKNKELLIKQIKKDILYLNKTRC